VDCADDLEYLRNHVLVRSGAALHAVRTSDSPPHAMLAG
jgi:hypothetical protein